jgi:hypothetical protein
MGNMIGKPAVSPRPQSEAVHPAGVAQGEVRVSLPPVASSRQAPEGLPPPRREATRRVAAEDKPVTAYLAARVLDGRPVEGESLERLQRADQVVQASRRTLMHGHGNVTTDVAAT